MNRKKDISKEDIKTWEEYTKNPSDIYDKDEKSSKESSIKNRFKFDLHGFTLDDANDKVREIILSCIKNKFKEILFITGKGLHSKNEKDIYTSKDLGKLKFSVPEYIRTNTQLSNHILSIKEADIKDGGAGAILVKLRNL